MSISNNTEIKSPAKKFITWNGEKGGFKFYDKENKVNVDVPLPVTFIVMDTLHCIKGFNKEENNGYYSNEIRDFKKETLNVRCGKHTFAEGLYHEVLPKCPGAKYSQSVYALMKEGESWIINNFQLIGASVGPWITFCKSHDIYKIAVQCNGMEHGKTGKVEFEMPIFKAIPVSDATRNIAIEKDKELQTYLTAYFLRQGAVEKIPASIIEEHNVETPHKSEVPASVSKESEETLSDLPF